MKNKKIRQMFAMTLTGVMLCTLPVCAAEPAENTETAENCGNAEPDSAKTETSEKRKSLRSRMRRPKELVQEYTGWLKENKARAVTGTYSSELKKFPADYQELLAHFIKHIQSGCLLRKIQGRTGMKSWLRKVFPVERAARITAFCRRQQEAFCSVKRVQIIMLLQEST